MRYRLGGVTAVVMLFLLLSLSFVSASHSSAPFNNRYEGPKGQSSASYYENYNDGSGSYDNYGRYRYPNQQQATTPIFKGSYGNYRYQGYANGDYRPSLFFVDYPEYSYNSYFSGGVGGYGRGYGYGGFGSGGFGSGGFGPGYSGYNYPSYSYNNYGSNYYPSYDYQYLGGCSYSYC